MNQRTHEDLALAQIRQKERDYEFNFSARNYQGMSDEFYTADAVLILPDGQVIVGRKALTSMFATFGEVYGGVALKPIVTRSGSGDLLYQWANSSLIPRPGASVARIDGKYLAIWRRLDSGWFCEADFFAPGPIEPGVMGSTDAQSRAGV
jgi:ketosteroid isomerase-like protein